MKIARNKDTRARTDFQEQGSEFWRIFLGLRLTLEMERKFLLLFARNKINSRVSLIGTGGEWVDTKEVDSLQLSRIFKYRASFFKGIYDLKGTFFLHIFIFFRDSLNGKPRRRLKSTYFFQFVALDYPLFQIMVEPLKRESIFLLGVVLFRSLLKRRRDIKLLSFFSLQKKYAVPFVASIT